MNKISKKTGFSLLEVMVALSLLVITISSTMALIANSFNVVTEAKNKIIARYLAQEAIEYVRKVRDDQAYENEWLKNPLTIGADIGVDVYDNVVGDIKPCGFMNQCILTYDSLTGEYSHDNSFPNTIFTRKININELQLNIEAIVTVTMLWQHKGTAKSFILTEHIFNYKIIP